MRKLKNNKLKILELCEFSAGICGVWTRVRQEAILLSKKGYEVKVFSSNFTKGSDILAKENEAIENIEIRRFPAIKLGGESFMKWEFEKAALDYKPDIIIAHAYRHPHTTRALKIVRKINSKVFLVTHAPFVEKGLRSFVQEISVSFYDFFIAKKNLNKFDRVIAITKWEIPYLLKLGVKKEKIVYIPNGIPEEFFKEKIKKFKGKKIMFLGRIAPIKDLGTLIKAFKDIENKRLALEIIGPIEEGYEQIKKFQGENIKFIPAIYDLKKKIKAMQETDIFVLPSKREAMPQALIEAMSLGKIVISSRTQGGKEIVEDNKTGFLFEIGNSKELTKKILWCLDKNNKKQIEQMKIAARKKAEEYKWSKLIKRLMELF